ncbi:MAG TPA: response regulator [Verrucomicrobiae bacterium]|jgi:CheY-like chemotaxis protein|nr:response regulator [Verrucomicrobiae bacterium]
MDVRQRILVVDDEPNIRRSLVVRLENSGYRVDTAENGQEALAFYQRALKEASPYDLILLDLIMPGLDGLGALDGIRQHEASSGISQKDRTPVVMLTALSGSWEEDARYEGCDDYIQKPFKTETLMEIIHKRIRPPQSPGIG